jgi:hypothetical protein
MKAAGHETFDLVARQFYRLRLGGLHFGLYIGADGQIHYFQKQAFLREWVDDPERWARRISFVGDIIRT